MPIWNKHIILSGTKKGSRRVITYVYYFIILLVVGFNIQFLVLFSDLFETLQWDWRQEKEPDTLGTFRLLEATSKNLRVLQNEKTKFDPDYTYILKDKTGKKFYYRYEYAKQKDDTLEFYGVYWLKGMPKFMEPEVQIARTQIPLVQNGKHTALTLGDQTVSRGKSERFRSLLSRKASLRFEGSHKDEWGFSYEGGVHTTLSRLQAMADTLRPRDYYFVMLTAASLKGDEGKRMIPLLEKLLKKKPKKIFVIAPKKSMDAESQTEIDNWLSKHAGVIWLDTENTGPVNAPYEKWAESLLKALP